MNIKDFKWTEKRFGTRFANILKKLGGLSKDGTDGSIEYKDEQGNVTKLLTDSNFSSLLAKNGLIEVKWQELKDKRDNGELIPGSLYRITDYQCTTTQENTRSAGHQFDIVLLALSENKLAEEGWAMMHDNIYDVTFSDGVTKKCWLYLAEVDTGGNQLINVVDTESRLGIPGAALEEFTINESDKTAFTQDWESDYLTEENLPYNYFQNSNLSAWKVWYCLDNDTDRFAWADNTYKLNPSSIICDCYRAGTKVDGPINNYGKQFVNGGIYYRDEENDTTIPFMGNVPAYAWTSENDITIFTTSVSPNSSSVTYTYGTGGLTTVGGDENMYYLTTSYVEGLPNYDFPNGRGVIYRLIDEWNIDYPCDFKNMQTLVPMDGNGDITMQNPVTFKYCYAFTDNTSGEPEDLSIKGHAINIKVKANLIEHTYSAMYFSPKTLFYTNHNESNSCKFSTITVGIAGITIFINRGNAINILDGSSDVILKDCEVICIGYNSSNIMLDAVVSSTFGSACENMQLANEDGLNYGNNGVELATKS